MPDTFLSLSKSNKLRIPFVQGKFNMGGTGVFQFSGRNNLQLIVSKRDPEIAKFEQDETKDCWGFTIVRREDPKEGRRSSPIHISQLMGKFLCLKPNRYLYCLALIPSLMNNQWNGEHS